MSYISPTTMGLLRTQMYNFQDYRGKKEECVPPENTIGHFLFTNPECKRMLYIVKKANFLNQVSEEQANFTMFVPLDRFLPQDEKFYELMDVGTAQAIVKSSLLNKKIDASLLTSSPSSYFTTLYSQNRAYVNNMWNETIINDCCGVIAYDIRLKNGIIHITNNLIIPNDSHYLN